MLYKHAGSFKNTREVHKEAQGAAEKEIVRAKARDISSVHYNSIKHAHDVCTCTLSSYNELELTNHSARIYLGIL